MLKLVPNAPVAERQEAREGLGRVRVGNTLHELVDGSNSVRADILRCVVEHETEHHVIQRLGEMNTYLAESARYSIDQMYWMQVSNVQGYPE